MSMKKEKEKNYVNKMEKMITLKKENEKNTSVKNACKEKVEKD